MLTAALSLADAPLTIIKTVSDGIMPLDPNLVLDDLRALTEEQGGELEIKLDTINVAPKPSIEIDNQFQLNVHPLEGEATDSREVDPDLGRGDHPVVARDSSHTITGRYGTRNDAPNNTAMELLTDGNQPAGDVEQVPTVGGQHPINDLDVIDSASGYQPIDDLAGAVNGSFRMKETDPLVLDLDGDGIELLSFLDASVHFDVDKDGFAEDTGWVSGDDGILVHNWKQPETQEITDVTEMFSEHYKGGRNEVGQEGERLPWANGFEALASLDANGDGVFSQSDGIEIFNEVAVWQDANEDGMTDGW